MIAKTIYQTLEDRDDPEYVENNGPFLCNRKNAWLSSGYYFWESYEDNAHWWGAGYSNGYIVCKAEIAYDIQNCFDLIDNIEHKEQLDQAAQMMAAKGIPKHQITVGNIIQFLRDRNFKSFEYKGVRAIGNRVRAADSPFSKTLKFTANHHAYIDLRPPVQICLFTKKSLGFRHFRIIFPEDYVVDDYLV